MIDDLISRKELMEEIGELQVTLCGRDIFTRPARNSVLRVINEQPAVDPHEHGRWIVDNAKLLYCRIHCSECGFGSDYAKRDMWMNYPGHKFCGACGAKMDLEATSNE